MRISDALRGAALGCAFILAFPAVAADTKTAVAGLDTKALQSESPAEAFKLGFDAYRQGDMGSAVEALQFAAEKGNPLAQWKLGRMYAAGDGIREDDLKAFQLFRQIANGYADQSPNDPSAPFVASAFVALGSYYHDGIPNSAIKSDPSTARQMYAYAASYFADADAQFRLAQMYYLGEGGERDPRQAARWSKVSADKGNVQGEALLGHLMFEGDGVQRQTVLGLAYLTVALHHASPDQEWIRVMQEQAFALATEQERRSALVLVRDRESKGASVSASAAAH